MNLGIIFLTGLTVGGLTCLAVQGGLLASVIASREKEVLKKRGKMDNVFPTLSFLLAKLFAYTILGFILGALGSVISLTSQLQSFIQLFAGIYMIVIALNLLDVHPIFRYAVIQPPRFLTKRIRNQSRSADFFAPGLLGLMTIFIPCGTTLAMEALAISTANPIKGGLIMATFVLGTFPMFFGIGYITTFLGEKFKDNFLRLAAILIVSLGVLSIYGGLVAVGAPVSLSKITSVFGSSNNSSNISIAYPPIKDGFQITTIAVSSAGYSPRVITLKANTPTRLSLTTNNAYSCAIAFRIPALRIGVNLSPSGTQTIELPPLKKGDYAFNCSMGMYTGVFKVL